MTERQIFERLVRQFLDQTGLANRRRDGEPETLYFGGVQVDSYYMAHIWNMFITLRDRKFWLSRKSAVNVHAPREYFWRTTPSTPQPTDDELMEIWMLIA